MNRKNKLSVISIYVIFGIMFWLIDTAFDYIFFHKELSFSDLLIFNIPPHDIYTRLIVILLFLIFGGVFYVLLLKRERAENLLAHSNRVIGAIRNINQIIMIEKDPEKLIKGICDLLVEPKGFSASWIILFDKSGKVKYSSQTGIGDCFSDFIRDFKEGKMPDCIKQASESDEVIIAKTLDKCGSCNLSKTIAKDAIKLVSRLFYNGNTLGYLSVILLPQMKVNLEEDEAFVKEIAGDISFALHDIEIDKEGKLSERRYKALFESPVNGIIVLKPCEQNGVFEIYDINKTAERIENISKTIAIGKNIREIIPHLDETGLFDLILKVSKTGKTHHFPLSLSKNGKLIFWRDNYVYRLETGEIVIIFRDETKRRKTELALENSEKKYKVLFDNSPDAVFIFDLVSFRLMEVNKVACERLGFSREELLNKNLSGITSAKYAPMIGDRIKQLLETGYEFYETEHIHRDGHTIPSEVSMTIIKFDEKPMALSIVRDITRRKLTERALRESEAKLNALFDNSPSLIYIKDIEGKYLVANRKFEELAGIPREKIEGITDFDIFPSEYASVFRDNDLKVIEKGTSIEIEEKVKIGNEIKTFISIKFPLLDSGGMLVGVCGILTDITDRVRLESQFLQAQKMETVARLAGGIAHDFNNILTVIIGYGDLLSSSIPKEDPGYNYTQEILKTTGRATSLINQLLLFSRNQILNPKISDLNEMLFDIDKLMRRIISEDIEMVILPEENLWPVEIDPGQFEQIISNLVINAKDAMPRGGKLTIETHNIYLDNEYSAKHPEVIPGDYVLINVTDTGIGMTEEAKAHLFEPFFTTKEKGKGTGLGLATCYGIVKQYGGHILVDSEVGQGTSFKIYFPRKYGTIEKDKTKKSLKDLTGGNETILLVEDESSVRKMATKVLTGKGYKVIEASNGEEALRYAENYKEGKIDLILTDVIMPQMGGLELADKIKVLMPETKVLFVSGYAESSIVDHGVLLPGVSFLQKPFTPTSLAEKIRTVLDSEQNYPEI